MLVSSVLVDEIAEKNRDARVWMIFFGDPFVIKKTNPSIFDMIIYAKNKGLTDVVLNSNGNLMDNESAGKIIKSNLDAIYFGIDAYKKSTYEKFRVGGDYEKTRDNVLFLLNLKKELKAEKPDVFVQFVEMEENRNEKDDYIRFWSDAGAKVKIRPMVSWAGKVDAPNLILTDDDRWPCHWAMQSVSITDQGDVVNCAVDLDAAFVGGNVNKQTISEIWNTTLAMNRSFHKNRQWNKLPDICRNCRDWQSARSEYVDASELK
jgi:radical SAM protein with 4Fe4S-binding SPASM domain